MPSDRQLRELRSLTPWNWDAKSVKHPPGQAALRDWERVEQAYLLQPGQGRTRQHDDALPNKKHAHSADKASNAAKETPGHAWEAQTPGTCDIDRAGPKSKRMKKSSLSHDMHSAKTSSGPPSAAASHQHTTTSTPATVAYDAHTRSTQQQQPFCTPAHHAKQAPGSGSSVAGPTPVPLGIGASTPTLTPTPHHSCPPGAASASTHSGRAPSSCAATAAAAANTCATPAAGQRQPATAADGCSGQLHEGVVGDDTAGLSQGLPSARGSNAGQQHAPPASASAAACTATTTPGAGAHTLAGHSSGTPSVLHSSRRPLHKRQHRRAAPTTPAVPLSSPHTQPQRQAQAAHKRRVSAAVFAASDDEEMEEGGEADTHASGAPCSAITAGLLQHSAPATQPAAHAPRTQQQRAQTHDHASSDHTPELMDASLTLLSMAPPPHSAPHSAQPRFTHHHAATAPSRQPAPHTPTPPPPATTPHLPQQQQQQQQLCVAQLAGSPPSKVAAGSLSEPESEPLSPSPLRTKPRQLTLQQQHMSPVRPPPLLQQQKHGVQKQQNQQQQQQAGLPFPGLRRVSSSKLNSSKASTTESARSAMKENIPPNACTQPTALQQTLRPPGQPQQQQQQQKQQQQRLQQGSRQPLGTLASGAATQITSPPTAAHTRSSQLPQKPALQQSAQAGARNTGTGADSVAPPSVSGAMRGSAPAPPSAAHSTPQPQTQTQTQQQTAAAAAVESGPMGGLLAAARTASLHHIVRAVAAYCHAMNVSPSPENVAQAQAIIGLLHAGEPGQAAEALHQLQPACEAEGQLQARVSPAPASLPIAPLTIPAATTDLDACTPAHPVMVLTLQELVASHKALRDAALLQLASATLPRHPTPPPASAIAPASAALKSAACKLPVPGPQASAPLGVSGHPFEPRTCLGDQSNRASIVAPMPLRAGQAGCVGVLGAAAMR